MSPLAFIPSELVTVLYTALGSLLLLLAGGVGYLIRRRLERKHQFDALDMNERALRLLKDMSSQNLTIDELHERRELLLNPKNRLASENRRQREVIRQYNQAFAEVINTLDATLLQSSIIRHLDKKLLDTTEAMWLVSKPLMESAYRTEFEDGKDFFASQREWNEAAEAQAEAARKKYDDLALGMMIFFATKEAATQARIAFLQRKLVESPPKALLEPPPDTCTD